MKDVLKNFLRALGITIFIGIFISHDFRVALGSVLAPFLDPMYEQLGVLYTVMILAVFTAFYSTLIQKLTVDYSKMKEIQQKVMEFQKEYSDAVKKNNQEKLKRLEKDRDEVMRLQSQLMSMQFDPMFYTVIVTIPIFMWMYKISTLNPIVNVPFAGEIHVGQFYLIFPWWIWWYMFNSIVFGQVVRKVLKVGV
ncbi:EMC3/TMCO1 family protein [Geoglobus acetivorans]|uniref:EMC3/TMCO1 family protein n=1 Tax=Geoglobus acetivorans TaxID=565033 RepID=A0ABZ3H214_GEOAI|nr:DUF106 domain-containing protein [Geoglobus acetivorans]